MNWIKRLVVGYKINYMRRHIYEKGGKYEIGADTPFGEISSFEDFYTNSIQEVINYFKLKYELNFSCQSSKKMDDETLIRLYFYR